MSVTDARGENRSEKRSYDSGASEVVSYIRHLPKELVNFQIRLILKSANAAAF